MYVTHEEAVVAVPRASPELPAVELEKARIGKPRDIRPAGEQRCDLGRQPPWRIPVVVIPVDDESAARQFASTIALGADAQPPGRMDIADTRIAAQLLAVIDVAIIGDDELALAMVLPSEISDGLHHPFAPIACGHDATDKRSLWRRRRGAGTERRADDRQLRRCRGRRSAIQRLAKADAFAGREVSAGIAFAMPGVGCPLATEAQAAELVLVAPLIRLEPAHLLLATVSGRRTTVDEGALRPNRPEPRPDSTQGVVHFPARSGAIAHVRAANGLDHVAAHCVAEICQAMERLHRSPSAGEPRFGQGRSCSNDRLHVPRSVGRRTSK